MAWSLKKIFKLRQSVGNMVQIRFGDGRGTLFWQYTWFEGKLIITRQEFQRVRIRPDFQNVLVREVKEGIWGCLLRRILGGQRVLKQLNRIKFHNRIDSHTLEAKKDGRLKSSKVWKVIREREQIVEWAPLVWSSKDIMRHQFILWLVFCGRLNTRDRIKKYMNIPDTSCLL
ncbi:uncharacterized protein LOC124929330 [Impatiens glandulifera]|uniref:uncharacterized protein LOC124929330 n=1 Tax=Impatiens glandulifera TaxID=253017 RepID=UPI001FB0CDC9|nr:uncharacterized protein LOC124929330 [Impatiens glandulifera]